MATVYIGGVRAGRMAIGTTEIANILKGTSDPSSSIGDNGQLYLKYGNDTRYTYSETLGGYVLNGYFYSEANQLIGTVGGRGYSKNSNGAAIAVMWKNSSYSGPLLISTVESNITYTHNTSGSLGSATIDGITWYLSTTNYWSNPVETSVAPIIEADYYPTASSRLQDAIEAILEASDFRTSLPTNVVTDSFAKVNGQWQNLIGTDIDDIQSGGSLEIGCPKIFDDADRIDGKYIDPNDGTEKTDDPDSACTDFIDISSYDFFIVDYNCTWQNHYYNAFYDSSKQYIQGFSLTPNTLNLVDDIPVSAKYVRISWSIATETNVYGATFGIKPIPAPSPIV